MVMDSGIVSLTDDVSLDKINATLLSVNDSSNLTIVSNETTFKTNDLNDEPIFPVLLLSNSTRKDDSHAVFCNYCKKNNFTEYRYKCLICNDFDLCGTCFERRIVSEDHLLEHPMARYEKPKELFGTRFETVDVNLAKFVEVFAEELHNFVSCDGCSMTPIKGLRFKCDACNNYDLCYKCYLEKKSTLKHTFSEHPLVVFGKEIILELDASNIELLNEIGKGAFGTVFQARSKTLDRIVACKIIKINKIEDPAYKLLGVTSIKLYKSYFQELNAYKELKGVNILKMFGYCIQELSDGQNLMIITEYMSRGSLTNLLENEPNLSYRKRLDIACGIASGMTRIHEHNFIHRDIRPDNILISSNYTAKIGDMGIAKLIETSQNSLMGCRKYMPIEFYTGTYDQKLDVFTFGLTINELYNGSHTKNPPIVLIKKSPYFTSIIMKCINLHPVNRPMSKTVNQCLIRFQKLINRSILKKAPNYIQMSSSYRNEIFKSIYDSYVDEIKI